MRNRCPQQRCQQIVRPARCSTLKQKRHFLALEAENALPLSPLPEDARQALDEGVIGDICFEGHASQTALRVARLRPISG